MGWIEERVNISLVISLTNSTKTKEFLEGMDGKEHPFSEVVLMGDTDSIESLSQIGIKTRIPIRYQARSSYAGGIDTVLMDMCEVEVNIDSKWFMLIDSELYLRDYADIFIVPNSNIFGVKPV